MSHAADHRHDVPSAATALRERGRRVTRQRESIWNALAAVPDRHLSADEIVAHVRSELPHLNASTVYRTLDLLVADGLVTRTDLGAGHSFYEPAHRHRHHHLVCDRCGRVEHVHDDALADLASRLRERHAFELAAAELTLHGCCAVCARLG